MASVSSILSLLVFTSHSLSKGSSNLTPNRRTRVQNLVSGRRPIHNRQRRQAVCGEIEFNATFPCTRKGFTELSPFDTCVRFSQSQMSLGGAKKACDDIDSKLVKIDDKDFHETLTEKGSPKKWWIGLLWKYGGYIWHGETKKAKFDKWQPPMLNLDEGTSSSCVYLNAVKPGRWSHAGCTDNLFFICQRASVGNQSLVAIALSGSENSAAGGAIVTPDETLQATCYVHGGVVDNAIFLLEDHATELVTLYDSTMEEVHISPDHRYERLSGVCWRITTITLTLPVTLEMDNDTVHCLAQPRDGRALFSPKKSINVKVPPRRPTLTIEFDEEPTTVSVARDSLVVNCLAPTGVKGRAMTWAIRNTNKLWVWAMRRFSKDTSISVKHAFEVVTPEGRVMNSTVVIQSRFGFKNMSIACFPYYNASEMSRSNYFGGYNPLRTVVGPIRVKAFDPQAPRLTRRFVNQQGEPGVKVKVQCIAFVGWVRKLTWSLQFGNGDRTDLLVYCDNVTIHRGQKLRKGIVVGETKARQLKKKGHEVMSTLIIASTKVVENATITCFSHEEEPRLDELRKSVAFYSKDIPPLTQLSVSYHKSLSTVYGNRTLRATCTARLGNNGTLVWALRTRDGETMWTLSRDGKLNSGGSADVDVRATEVQKDHSVLTSKLSLVVNGTLDGGNLTCGTRPDGGLTEVWEISRNLVVRYLARRPILLIRDPAPSVTWFREVNCSAYVGSSGVITWLLLATNESFRWQFNTTGSLFGVIPAAVNVTDPVVTFHTRHGPRINSSLKIDAREFPEETSVACSSDNSSVLMPGHNLMAWGYLHPAVRPEAYTWQFGGIDGMGWSIILLVFFHLLLLGALLIFAMKQRGQSLDKRSGGEDAWGPYNDEPTVDWGATETEVSESQVTPSSSASDDYSISSWSSISSSVDPNK